MLSLTRPVIKINVIYISNKQKKPSHKKKKVHKTEPVKTVNRKKISLEKPEIISIQIRFVSKHSD